MQLADFLFQPQTCGVGLVCGCNLLRPSTEQAASAARRAAGPAMPAPGSRGAGARRSSPTTRGRWAFPGRRGGSNRGSGTSPPPFSMPRRISFSARARGGRVRSVSRTATVSFSAATAGSMGGGWSGGGLAGREPGGLQPSSIAQWMSDPSVIPPLPSNEPHFAGACPFLVVLGAEAAPAIPLVAHRRRGIHAVQCHADLKPAVVIDGSASIQTGQGCQGNGAVILDGGGYGQAGLARRGGLSAGWRLPGPRWYIGESALASPASPGPARPCG